jgi:hypothetical protein
MRLIPPVERKPSRLAEASATIAGASLGLGVGALFWWLTSDPLWFVLAPVFALAALGILGEPVRMGHPRPGAGSFR